MSKHKTRKSAAKRFKVTGTGKLLHRSQKIRHLRHTKSKRQVRDLRQMKQVFGKYEKKIKKMLGIR